MKKITGCILSRIIQEIKIYVRVDIPNFGSRSNNFLKYKKLFTGPEQKLLISRKMLPTWYVSFGALDHILLFIFKLLPGINYSSPE